MAKASRLVFNILSGKNTVSKDLGKVRKQAKKTTGAIGSITKGVKEMSFTIKAAAAIWIGSKLVEGFQEFKGVVNKSIKSAQDFENAMVGLNSVARSTGSDIGLVTEAVKDLSKDGLIPTNQVAESLKNLLSAGFGAEESIKMFKVLRDSAAFNRSGMLDLGTAIAGATQGIKNQNSTLVDNAGITKNLSVMYQEYGRSISTSSGKLSEAQKRQAIYNGLLKEGAIFQGDYTRSLDTYTGKISQLKGSYTTLFTAFGETITKAEGVKTNLDIKRETIDLLVGLIRKNKDSIVDFINRSFIAVSGFVVDAIPMLGKITETLIKVGFEVKTLANTFIFFLGEAFTVIQNEIVPTFINGFNKLLEYLPGLKEKIKELTDDLFGEGDTETTVGKAIERVRAKYEAETKAEEEGLNKILALNKKYTEIARASFQKDHARYIKARKKQNKKELDVIEKQDSEKKKKKILWENWRKQYDALTDKEKLSNMRSTLGTISTLTSQNNKELFFVGKAAAVADATIAGFLAVQKALASAPPPFNFALAGLVGTATALNVAKIAKQKPPAFNTGGILDPNGSNAFGDSLMFRGNSGEAILTKQQQRRFIDLAEGGEIDGNENLAEAINGLRDDLARQPIIVEVESREIARAVRDQVQGGFAIA